MKIDKDEILDRFKAKAIEHGKDFADLNAEGVGHLTWVAGELADTVSGDPRARAHLQAQLSALNFQNQAQAYLAAVEWRNILIDVIEEIGTKALEVGLDLALNGLLDGLKSVG